MTSHFPSVALREVVTTVERPESPVPGQLYRQVGVQLWGRGAYEREPLDGGRTRYKTLSRVEADDIILNKIWARNGSVAVVPPGLAGCYVSGEFPTFRPIREKLAPRWFHWYSKTPALWNQCDERSRGTSGKNRIRPEKFLEIEIPLPSPEEQRRIVSRIEELAAKIEEVRELRYDIQGRTSSIFQLHRENILEDYVGHRPTVTLDEATILISGLAWPSGGFSQLPIGLPVIRIQNLGDSPSPSLVYWSGSYDERFTVQQGDLLLSLSGSFKAEYWKGPKALLNQRIVKCEPRRSYDKCFLFHVLQNLLAHIISQTTQTSVKNVSMKVIRKLPFPALPLTEQRRVAAYLDDLQAKVDGLKKLQSETAAELDTLMPSILSKAFRGEL